MLACAHINRHGLSCIKNLFRLLIDDMYIITILWLCQRESHLTRFVLQLLVFLRLLADDGCAFKYILKFASISSCRFRSLSSVCSIFDAPPASVLFSFCLGRHIPSLLHFSHFARFSFSVTPCTCSR